MSGADYLDLGNYNATCSMCGGKFKASELEKNWQGMYRCWQCNEPRQPQDYVRAVPDIQTPSWVQPRSVRGNGIGYLTVEESETSLDLSTLFNSIYTGLEGQLSSAGITKVVINIIPGNSSAQVIITSLIAGTSWPASVTSLVINIGSGAIVIAFTNNSGLPATLNGFNGTTKYLFTQHPGLFTAATGLFTDA